MSVSKSELARQTMHAEVLSRFWTQGRRCRRAILRLLPDEGQRRKNGALLPGAPKEQLSDQDGWCARPPLHRPRPPCSGLHAPLSVEKPDAQSWHASCEPGTHEAQSATLHGGAAARLIGGTGAGRGEDVLTQAN
jgi:hypothetical protein